MPHTYMRTVCGGSNGTTARRAVSYRRTLMDRTLPGRPILAVPRHVEDSAAEIGRDEGRDRRDDSFRRGPPGEVEVGAELVSRALGFHGTRAQGIDDDAVG